MGNAANYMPALKYGHKIYPQNIISPLTPVESGNVWFVDGDKTTGGSGTSWEDAWSESDFDGALTALSSSITAGDVIYVAARSMTKTSTDPVSYTTNLTIDVPQISLIGVSRGRTQGGLPQLKVGGTTTQAIIRVRAPGVLIQNIGINGAGATGGGIRYDDDGGTTYASFGGSVLGCHFKNCRGTSATEASGGGAISLSGAPWQMLISGNKFYKNLCDVCLLDTSTSVPQDWVIEDNIFSGPAASCHTNLYLKGGGDGVNGVYINNNIFPVLGTLGTDDMFMDLTGCIGSLTNNTFGFICDSTGTTGTFAATGTAAFVPAEVFMMGNKGESTTVDKLDIIFRT